MLKTSARRSSRSIVSFKPDDDNGNDNEGGANRLIKDVAAQDASSNLADRLGLGHSTQRYIH